MYGYLTVDCICSICEHLRKGKQDFCLGRQNYRSAWIWRIFAPPPRRFSPRCWNWMSTAAPLYNSNSKCLDNIFSGGDDKVAGWIVVGRAIYCPIPMAGMASAFAPGTLSCRRSMVDCGQFSALQMTACRVWSCSGVPVLRMPLIYAGAPARHQVYG